MPPVIHLDIINSLNHNHRGISTTREITVDDFEVRISWSGNPWLPELKDRQLKALLESTGQIVATQLRRRQAMGRSPQSPSFTMQLSHPIEQKTLATIAIGTVQPPTAAFNIANAIPRPDHGQDIAFVKASGLTPKTLARLAQTAMEHFCTSRDAMILPKHHRQHYRWGISPVGPAI